MTTPTPSGSMISVRVVGWQAKRGKLAHVTKAIKDHLEQMLDGQLKILLERAQDLSPRGKRDESGRATRKGKKRTGRDKPFVLQWATATEQTKSGAHGVLYNRARHAPFVMLPTKRHVIKAKNAKFLAFEVNGHMVFKKSVMHPGTKGNPVIERTWQQHGSNVQRAMEGAAEEVVVALRDVFTGARQR